jgi:hypothetical protein
MNRCFGGGQSLSGWQRSRLALSCESKAAAKQRKEELELNETPETKLKNKDHTGDLSSVVWDKEALKAEVEGYNENHLINWKELASRYNVCNTSGQLAKNGGQMVKEWLVSQGVDVTRFRTKRQNEDAPVIRRKKRKGPGGEISLPTEISVDQLKEKLSNKIQSGEYTIGEMIVPKKVFFKPKGRLFA